VKEWLTRLRTAYEGLSSREQMLVLGAAGLIGIALLYLVIVSPIRSFAASASERVTTAEQELEVVRRLRREYDEVHGRLATVEERIRRLLIESTCSEESMRCR